MTSDKYTSKHSINPKHLAKTGKISNKKPSRLKPGNHWHRCYDLNCLTFWQHSNFGGSHYCPRCNKIQIFKWWSSKDNGKRQIK